MRQTHIPDKNTASEYRAALNHDYGYIYSVQNGGGIGGFFKKMMNFLIPIGKSALHKGLELAKPELNKLVEKGAEELGKQATKGIEKGRVALQKKLNKKRKVDALS